MRRGEDTIPLGQPEETVGRGGSTLLDDRIEVGGRGRLLLEEREEEEECSIGTLIK